jgi:DNA-binding response OmpR family regulator
MKRGAPVPPRILVVEDESFVRALIVDRLVEAGFDVDQARNSDAALRLIEADGYALLVTKMAPPGRLSGTELAEQSHHERGHVPVVFVAAKPGTLERLRSAGLIAASLPHSFALDDLVSLACSMTGTTLPQ